MGAFGDVATEEVEKAIAAIAQYLEEWWVAVDLQGGGERLTHQHPPGCPKKFKSKFKFEGQKLILFQVKGKFRCGNEQCRRSWSSAMVALLLTVQPERSVYKFSVTALEQGCQRCGRDVYARMYTDEAARVAEWLTDAYEWGKYPEQQQRASRMRRPHDKQRCTACRAGLH